MSLACVQCSVQETARAGRGSACGGEGKHLLSKTAYQQRRLVVAESARCADIVEVDDGKIGSG